MKRKFFSGNVPCGASCSYCFAKWQNVESKHPIFAVEKLIKSDDDSVIIYPCCDSEFFEQSIPLKDILKLKNRFIYVSISTKQMINTNQLNYLKLLDNELKRENRGFVKLSVSFSNKYYIDRLEKGTTTYRQRVNLLEQVQNMGIYTSAIIKPILPFITLTEYKEIIDDLAFIKKFVLGDLYVDINSRFYKEYIEGKYDVSIRKVAWLNEPEYWNVIEDVEKKRQLYEYIEKKSCEYFESDNNLILSYIHKKMGDFIDE